MKKPLTKDQAENKTLSRGFLLLIAFFEGAAVMAVELGGAKIVAPYYGTSLYVWSSVLAVTLGGLTTGYYLGGYTTGRYNPFLLLILELITGTVLIALMPLIGLTALPATSELGVRLGSLLSTLLFMMPPLICMGMVSPTIIQLSNKDIKETGKTAGTVYAISTIGGILMTLLMGFFLLSEYGIRISLLLAALPLALITIYLLSRLKTLRGLSIGAFSIVCLMTMTKGEDFKDPKIPLNFLYKSEGILGQISVLKNPDPQTGVTYRHLFINHIAQTWVDEKNMPISEWGYPHRIATYASIKPPGSKVLMIGLGGGSVAMELKKLGFDLDIVELDDRIPYVAKTFFSFDPEGLKVYIDDGRHFINSSKDTYDLIFIDVLNGEAQPHHLFTQEAIRELKRILNPTGLLIINNQGGFFGPNNKGPRSIYKTLVEESFHVQVYNRENKGDIHFMASQTPIDFHSIMEERLNLCCRTLAHSHDDLIANINFELEDAEVLTDNKPALELMNNQQNETWRRTAIGAIIKREKDNGIPFFR